MNRSRIAASFVIVVMMLTAVRQVQATIVTIDAVNSGRYQDSGWYNGTQNNMFVGNLGPWYRNWLGFDLSTVTDTITSATLEVASDPQNTSGQLFTWSDVTTAYASLGTTSGVPIYEDLGTGVAFASGTHTPGTINSFALNAAGIASLNSATSYWAVGGSHSAFNGSAFGYTDGVGSGDHIKLVLNTSNGPVVPEPATFAIWSMLGGLGMIAARRRRKQVLLAIVD